MTIIIQNFESLENQIIEEFQKFEIGYSECDCKTIVSFNSEDLWFVEQKSRFVDSRKKEISIFYKIPDIGKPKDNEIPKIPEKLKIIATIVAKYDSPIRSIVQNNKDFKWEVTAYSGAYISFDAEADSLRLLIKIVNDKIIKEFKSINDFITQREILISRKNKIIQKMFIK